MLSLPVFWTGFTPVLAGAAIALKLERGLQTRRASLAASIGGLTGLAAVVFTILGTL